MDIILGIDPGTLISGFAVLQATSQKPLCLDAGTIYLKRLEPHERLARLQQVIETIIEKNKPTVLAIERAFVSKNIASALKLSHARGVVMAVAGRYGMRCVEYAPRTVKCAVTGSGNADKKQMQRMMQYLLGLPAMPQSDCADAMAVAYCQWLQKGLGVEASGTGRMRRGNKRWTERDLMDLRRTTRG